MTVEEMLHRVSSRELTEWIAYEQKNGPLGHQYSDDVLASILEALHTNTFVAGLQYDPNPVPEPKRVPRPPEVMQGEEVQFGFDALGDALPGG
ncbi:hypothetical protein [Nocardia sp. NPDC057440]|uniref:phage tail assembly protein T n=1 Tax=Nocardia sp. NPDC057440 TaxID=3346134 RepID=UPI0036735565